MLSNCRPNVFCLSDSVDSVELLQTGPDLEFTRGGGFFKKNSKIMSTFFVISLYSFCELSQILISF